jgi:hypothetical protein
MNRFLKFENVWTTATDFEFPEVALGIALKRRNIQNLQQQNSPSFGSFQLYCSITSPRDNIKMVCFDTRSHFHFDMPKRHNDSRNCTNCTRCFILHLPQMVLRFWIFIELSAELFRLFYSTLFKTRMERTSWKFCKMVRFFYWLTKLFTNGFFRWRYK